MRCILAVLFIMLSTGLMTAQTSTGGKSYFFDGHYGQVEVGGRYAGAEFHLSRPLLSRISFYYPVANSIDLSTDYWKRESSMPMSIGVNIGGTGRRWIGREPWSYTVSPHKVIFQRNEHDIAYTVSYEFCLNEPAMVVSLVLRNLSSHAVQAEVYTHLVTSLRTCQTYARMDSAMTSYDDSLRMIEADFDNPETDRASVFVENVGEVPASWSASAEGLSVTDSGTSAWVSRSGELQHQSPSARTGKPVSAFTFQKMIESGDSLSIIQVVGSCRRNEVRSIASRLHSSWRKEIIANDEFVRLKAGQQSHFITGDPWLDNSAVWARGILASNAHYLDTKIVPMPCPAEYNFFFTHDVLMTDLAAVNFDLRRVKTDLLYVISLSKERIIPHAYYWRDDGYKTEFCTPDNWNHFWFILLAGSYLRHSMDDSTGRQLYPLVTKSLEEVLLQVKSDHLMYAFRPDWWDLGHIEGPRAYTTILTIRALREYLFISSLLQQRSPKLLEYELLADSMQNVLGEKLWDDKMGYLVNYNDGKKDEHYYMGSILAVAYDLLNEQQARKLQETAEKELMAANVGIRTAMPPDFHTKEAIDFYKFHGDEAGQPFLYINGGVWPHCNAWYALSLNAVGKKEEALKFVKSTMTVEGIMKSPMGQPAMYEYRYTDSSSKEYGRIDKPSFLWAGGFYLKTLYALFGVKENEWNISFAGPVLSKNNNVQYSLECGGAKDVRLIGNSKYLQTLAIGVPTVPTAIMPIDQAKTNEHVTVTFGNPARPYLSSINAILLSASGDDANNRLTYKLSSFQGHRINAHIISPGKIKEIRLDGTIITTGKPHVQSGEIVEYTIDFTGSDALQNLQITFEKK